jgi:formylglycine-generating enzyme required for sulfatase activity
VHDVTLLRRFELSAVPVTWAMYRRFDPEKPHPWGTEPDAADHPVVEVTWYEAAAFAAWLDCRLPSEVEWEFACRAGSTTRFWSGDSEADLFEVDWVTNNSGMRTQAVATPPTARGHDHPFGLYDLHGNAWEFCAEVGTDDYASHAARRAHDPVEPVPVGDPREWRPVRSGGLDFDPRFEPLASRYLWHPSMANISLSFRLVRLPLPPAPDGET